MAYSEMRAVKDLEIEELVSASRRRSDIQNNEFRSEQISGKLPNQISNKQKNIVILHTSEDEYSDVDDSLKIRIAEDLQAFVRLLSDRYADKPIIHIYIRLHPRLRVANPNSISELVSTKYNNVSYIMPGEPVDTFALAKSAAICICYGSTAGPESILFGAKTVSIGDSAYSGTGMMPEIYNIHEIDGYLDGTTEYECNIRLAASYLCFLRDDGIPFKFVMPTQARDSVQVWNPKINLAFRKISLRGPLIKLNLGSIFYLLWRIHLFSHWRCAFRNQAK